MFLVSKQKASGEGRVKAASLLLLFTLVLLSLKGFSLSLSKDSTKNKYDLNDPRNPNCPCHKHQQLAEDEYRQLQGNLNNVYINQVNENIGNKLERESGNGFGVGKISLNLKKISIPRFKRAKTEGSEAGDSKKTALHGVHKDIFTFSYMKMKFPSSKSHTVKHRKMKGRFGGKLNRCFHF